MQDVECRVVIAIEHDPAFGADVCPNRQRFLDDRATFRTLLTGVVGWDGDHSDLMQGTVALNPLEEDPPTCIMDRFSQLAIANHIPDLKVFIGKQVARRDIRVCHFAGKILTLPVYLQMLLGKCFSGFPSVSRFLLFTRESPLETFELLLSFTIVPGVMDRIALRIGDVGFEPDIDAQLLTGWNVFDFAFCINTELAIAAICASNNTNTLNHVGGKFLDTLIWIADQFEMANATAITECDVTAIVVKLPPCGFVLDAPVVVLKLGVAFLTRLFVTARLIEARNSKPCAISSRLPSHRIEATSKGVLLGKHFTVSLQVVFGGAWMVHPQPQAFVADELDNANSFINGGILLFAARELVFVDQHAACSFHEYRYIISHMSIYKYSSYRRA